MDGAGTALEIVIPYFCVERGESWTAFNGIFLPRIAACPVNVHSRAQAEVVHAQLRPTAPTSHSHRMGANKACNTPARRTWGQNRG
jgi:pyrroloquinoline quinone (PQQ) biosynthesis protein C